MADFDPVAHVKSNGYVRGDQVMVTAPPEKLTVESEGGKSFYLDPLMDGDSLVWVYLSSRTFEEFLPGYSWIMDDPGILYVQRTPNGEPIDDDTDELIVPLAVMQPVADVLLERYRAVVEQLVLEGRAVDEYGDEYGADEDDEEDDDY